MSLSGVVRKNMSLGGASFNQSSTLTGDGAIVHDVSVDAGEAGDLTTRTDNDTGVVTVDDSGHSFEQDDRVDLYWDGGCRRGMSVTNVSVNAISIDGGSGDNLPTQDTDVVLIAPTELDVAVLGTNVQAILLYTEKLGQFSFCATGPTEHWQKELGEGKVFIWETGDGSDNPITGDSIVYVYVSHGDAAAATMRVGVLYNNE